MRALSSAHRRRLLGIALLSIAVLLAVAALPPIPQPGKYRERMARVARAVMTGSRVVFDLSLDNRQPTPRIDAR